MSDDNWDDWWRATRGDLPELVERLRPEDALAAIKAMVAEADAARALAVAVGVVRGSVARRGDEERRL